MGQQVWVSASAVLLEGRMESGGRSHQQKTHGKASGHTDHDIQASGGKEWA